MSCVKLSRLLTERLIANGCASLYIAWQQDRLRIETTYDKQKQINNNNLIFLLNF